jgi:hypothetical protein
MKSHPEVNSRSMTAHGREVDKVKPYEIMRRRAIEVWSSGFPGAEFVSKFELRPGFQSNILKSAGNVDFPSVA